MICVNYLVTDAACQKLPPIKPALHSMLFDVRYAPNYASIIGSHLHLGNVAMNIRES